MKIGVVSDTHLADAQGIVGSVKQSIRNKRSLPALRELLRQHFREVDQIIHAGDLVDAAVLDMLQELAPVVAVQGNMDPRPLRANLPEQRILEAAGFRIGITHGSGGPEGIIERVRARFHEPVDAIVFGHTHHPVNETRDGILFFNPGSPTDRMFAPYNALGLLELSDTITGMLIRL
jgi:hypothetical protein